MSSVRLNDAAERATALDTSRSFIVQAPAGSGKTGLLIQRTLALLATVAQPEEVVAITFTRKAAAEMRERLLTALHLADGPAPEADYEKHTWTLARAVLDQDLKNDWGLTRNPSRLRILTIDAFCASLVAQMPVLSMFGAMHQVNAAPTPLYRRAARRLLSGVDEAGEAGAALSSLLGYLDNDRQRVEGLLEDMLASRDRWLPIVAGRDRPELSRESLEDTLRACIDQALERVAAALPDDLADELIAIVPGAAQQVDDDHPLAVCRNMDAIPAMSSDHLPRWLGLRQLLLTDKGTVRKDVRKTEGFPAPGTTRDKDEKALRTAAKTRAKKLLGAVAENPALYAALDALKYLPAARYDADQWRVLSALQTLLPLAAAELLVLFRDTGQVDFTEQSQRALRALGTEDEPTELALALDYRINHLLIDEFQDTSRSQFELTSRLVAGWQPGDGRTLFLVGDPMQSIYRFRDADVGLFLEAQRYGIGEVATEPLTLRANFRSRPALVGACNDIFDTVFPRQANAREGAVPFSAADAQRDAGGDGVHIHSLHDATVGDEASLVIRLVRNALSTHADGDVAILARGRSHLAEIMPGLAAAGIEYHAVDIVPLRFSPVVVDLSALTRALMHYADRTAWLSILRAPWCGLTLADLHALVGEDSHRTVWEQMIQPSPQSSLSEDGALRLARIKSVLASALAQRGRRDLRRWVEGTWQALGGPACVTTAHEQRNAQTFLALLEELDSQDDALTLSGLDRAVDALYAETPGTEQTRLSIMTIHKAKGLEFDTVIVPGLHRKPPPAGSALLHWLEFADDSGRLQRLLAPIRAASVEEDSTVGFVRRIERERERAESRRLLYVAATRAREALHLVGCCDTNDEGEARPPAEGTAMRLLWPALSESFATPAPFTGTAIAAATEEGGPPRLTRVPSSWLLPQTPQPKPWRGQDAVLPVNTRSDTDWTGDAARLVGTAVHRILQQVATEGLDNWMSRWFDTLQPFLARMLTTLGVRPDELDTATERAVLAVKRCLDDERGRWLLQSHRDARSELALSAWLGGRVRNVVLDRTFVDEDGTRWIVDYKTAQPGNGTDEAFMDDQFERYREQLELYARIVQRMDTAPIKLALYFPLLPGWRAWSFDGAST